MRTAVVDGLILTSPCKVDGAGSEHAAERPLASIAEVDALAEAMPERLRLVVLLATWCQLRRGEILGLRRQDIDLMHATIQIEQSRTFTMDGHSLIKQPKTAAGRRSLAVSKHLIATVAEHLDQFTDVSPEALVFTGTTGIPLTKSALRSAWDRARTTIGRTDLRLHDLRHTGLTLAAATGATTAELMHRAGHASPSAALRYQHATKDRDRVLAEALEALVIPATVIPLRQENLE
jgi:integrase